MSKQSDKLLRESKIATKKHLFVVESMLVQAYIQGRQDQIIVDQKILKGKYEKSKTKG